MPAWQPRSFVVEQVLPDGLLCRPGKPWGHSSVRIFLRNHPLQKKVKDRDWINCLCIKLPDPFQYQTIQSSVATVDQYDFGIPFDPQERARQVVAEKQAAK